MALRIWGERECACLSRRLILFERPASRRLVIKVVILTLWPGLPWAMSMGIDTLFYKGMQQFSLFAVTRAEG